MTDTFKKLGSIYENAKTYLDPAILFFVVGCKNDLDENRQVQYEEGKGFAAEIDAFFIETSAKTNFNVDELFSCIGQHLVAKLSTNN